MDIKVRMIDRLKFAFRKFAPFMVLLAIAIIFMSLGGKKYLDIHELAKMQATLLNYVAEHPVYFVLFFFASYFAVTVSLLPGLILFDLCAGYAIPQPFSTLLVLSSAWCGAAALFLASRHAFADALKGKGGKWVDKIRRGFDKYEDGYLVFLRIFPFFPYGAISIALGFVRISFVKYSWTTFLGIIPSAFILTMAGRHLNVIFNGGFSEKELFTPKIFIFYLIFSIIVLAPLFLMRKKKVECKDGEDCE